MPLPPRESGKLIASNASHVGVCKSAVKELAAKLYPLLGGARTRWREQALNPKEANAAAIDWIFFSDTLNFSFWSDSDEEKYMVDYGGVNYSGYWSLCAAMNRALDEGIPLTDAAFYSSVSLEEFGRIFRSDSRVPMPMLEERWQVIRETGNTIQNQFGGSFATCIAQCDKSAQRLLQIIVDNFPSYRDVATFRGKEVSLYKRAQILIADIWACFEGKGFGEFHDIDTITMFADYRIPQALVYFGVLSYSDELTELLRTNHLFRSGDELEVEIRGASIYATDLLVDELKSLAGDSGCTGDSAQLNAIIVDHFLWDYRREHDLETKHIPFHKVRDIYY